MGFYIPGAGAHAVEQAIVGIRLFEPSDQAAYESAIQLAASLPESLPGRMKIDPMTLAFGRQVITHGYVNQAQLEPGFLFHRVNPDGSTEQELTIERSAVTYRTNNYQRWSDIVGILTNILCPVAQILASGDLSKLSVAELRCIDRFNVEGDGPTPLRALVREDSKLVPSALLDMDELLHSHCGWFQSCDESGRYLFNMNLDLSELAPAKRTATVLQVISAQSAPGGSFLIKPKPFADSVLEIFSELHRMDKAMLAGVITDELQQKIGLEGSSGIANL